VVVETLETNTIGELECSSETAGRRVCFQNEDVAAFFA
jgi:hypothetical protein